MHKFTTSTAEERKAHQTKMRGILMSMVGSEVTVTSTPYRGLGFRIKGTLEGMLANYSVRSADSGSGIDFNLSDVEFAQVTSSGNKIRLDTRI